MNKSRIKAILDNIPRDSFITSEALCQKLSLSKKTILNTIREINDFLKDKGACIETIPSRGLQLSITSPESYEAYLISLGQTQSQLPERPEQRLEYIVKRLIVSNQPISIDDLADELFVSRPTLHNDIKQVRQLLESFDLSLDSRRGQGLEITGSEYQKRRCLSHYVKAPFVDEGDIQKDILGQAIHLQDLVKSVLKEHDFHLSDIGFQNLIVHLLIAIKRVEKGNYAVPSNDILGDMVFSPKVNQLAQDLSQRILETYGVSMPESEHFYICLHLDSKRVLSRYASSGNNIVISDEVNLYLSRMFDLVYDTHLVDFRDNFDLKMNLGLHLIPLLVRLRFGMVLDNPLLQEIKQNMAWSYLMAQTAVTILEKDFQQKVDESEIAYIALHFNLALEQRKQQIKRKNVVIVCGSGIGSAELLKYRFMDRFGAYIQEIQTTDVFQF